MARPTNAEIEARKAANAAAAKGESAPPESTTVPKGLATTAGSAGDFNGADEAKFDHDNNGAPGGSLTVAERAKRAADKADAELRAQAQKEAAERAATPVPDGSGPSPKERGAAKIEAQERAKVIAAREGLSPAHDPLVTCRITRKGDAKVSMGEHVAGVGEAYYILNEKPRFPLSVARALEEVDYVEILDGPTVE